ncbi:MAG: hypothetical protein ACXWJZ_15390 [Burkholderiaceae bacterium]
MHVVMEDKPFHPVTQILMGPDGYFLPSLNGIKPFPTKGHILETLLRNREEQAGINIDCVPVADGYAGVREANDVLADDQGSAHLFKENEAHSDFLLHGKNTHRLQWECIRQWVQKGKLTLPKKTDGTTLSFAELNAIFAHVMVDRPGQALESLWQFTIDNISDLHGYDIEPPNTDDDDYLPFLHRGPSDGVSGVAPMEFISTIKCFGKELGLPYLQTCLVDSQIKQVNKMASRLVSLLDTEDNKSLQDMITKNTGLANWEDVKKSPGAYLHDAIVLFMLGTRESANEFGNSYPWTISNTDDIKRIEKKAEQTFQRNEREKFEAIYQAPSNNRWKKFVIKSDGK